MLVWSVDIGSPQRMFGYAPGDGFWAGLGDVEP